jgi:hypothetical protein
LKDNGMMEGLLDKKSDGKKKTKKQGEFTIPVDFC